MLAESSVAPCGVAASCARVTKVGPIGGPRSEAASTWGSPVSCAVGGSGSGLPSPTKVTVHADGPPPGIDGMLPMPLLIDVPLIDWPLASFVSKVTAKESMLLGIG